MRLLCARQGAGMADEKKPAQIPKSTPSGIITYFLMGFVSVIWTRARATRF